MTFTDLLIVTQVIWSGSDSPFNAPLPSNVVKTPPVTQVKSRSVVYRDASGVEREEKVDAIVLCTGYVCFDVWLINSLSILQI